MRRLIIGISGASGVILGIRLLKLLRTISNIETHLVISPSACKTLIVETKFSIKEIKQLASINYDYLDIAASISSGSFKTEGMIILPCSIKTLSGIVNSYNDNLLIRAADVVLKEHRRLILAIRETPLHIGHLRLMTKASEMGAIIMPPMITFYHKPINIDQLINQIVYRILDQFNINLPKDTFQRWK